MGYVCAYVCTCTRGRRSSTATERRTGDEDARSGMWGFPASCLSDGRLCVAQRPVPCCIRLLKKVCVCVCVCVCVEGDARRRGPGRQVLSTPGGACLASLLSAAEFVSFSTLASQDETRYLSLV